MNLFIAVMEEDRDLHVSAGQDALARYFRIPASDDRAKRHYEQVVLERERRAVAGYDQVIHLLHQGAEAVLDSYSRKHLVFQGTRHVQWHLFG